MMQVAITGASGSVGRQAIEALSDEEHDLALFSHGETQDLETTPIEIADYDRFAAALEGQDVLVHLAANPSPRADWDAVRGPNVDGLYNAFEVAAENDLQRVVFASSNHAVNTENAVSAIKPESTVGSPEVVRPDDPPRPDTYYGVTKVFGEAMGYYYARRTGMDVVNLRIGWLLGRDELREECAERDGSGERYARATWLSPEDCQRVIRAAADAPLPETPLTAHGISNNSERFLSLTETMQALEYRPKDDAAEVLDDDVDGRDGLRTD
ncbi:NAD-dependent epimerase/dehydratase family protein [Natrialbaceae archaeon GCM10025810]|uniref:NAD-dependent epimerase/dehydratase family protein n=1 Tax=Halovalidus salilacus TaxID=3075124 RepID=UPI00361BD48B